MEINLQGGALPQALPGARSADFPVIKQQETSAGTSVRVPQVKVDIKAAEEKRLEQLQKAAQHFFKDVYAVSDTTFSIFKDATGQYITRFTNLRDGKVTYIPEPQILKYAGNRTEPRQSLVEIQA